MLTNVGKKLKRTPLFQTCVIRYEPNSFRRTANILGGKVGFKQTYTKSSGKNGELQRDYYPTAGRIQDGKEPIYKPISNLEDFPDYYPDYGKISTTSPLEGGEMGSNEENPDLCILGLCIDRYMLNNETQLNVACNEFFFLQI